jgi:hypothetical protein
MTEEEAKTKWCPMTQMIAHPSGKVYASGMTGDQSCIGSACMAWRWGDEYAERLTDWEDAANIAGVQRGPEPQPEGWCGLAGKP